MQLTLLEAHLKPHQPECWDAEAAKWDEMIHSWENAHSIYYASCTLHIADFLPKDGIILSLGCGTADCALQLRRDGLTIVCTDFSKGMIQRAVQNHKDHEDGRVVFVLCDAMRLPFKNTSFDTVYARGVLLSYVPHPDKTMDETRRVLKPGGSAAFDAMNWEYAKRYTLPSSMKGPHHLGSLRRDHTGKVLLERRYSERKRQIRETIILDPSGRIAALLGERDKMDLFYAYAKDGTRIDQEGGEVQIRETGVKTVLPDGTTMPSYAVHTPTLFHALVEKEALSKEGKVAWFFTIQDLERLFRGVELEILRTAPLGCLHKLVIGVSPRMPPAMTPSEPVIRSLELAEFARQNVDKMAAIEKGLYRDLKIEEGLHIFIAARKPRQ